MVKNTPITRAQVEEAKLAGKRVICINRVASRAKRREDEREGRILNNRKDTPGRIGGAVLIKMAYFSMSVREKINRARSASN